MEKTKIVLSFDTEDLVHKDSAEGILRCVKVLDELGLRGCFNLVGLLAKRLKEWGREDVISALQNHEIDLHSYDHSYHPSINEYTATTDYNTALKEFLRRERMGVAMIDEAFGKHPHPAACPPGCNVSYVSHYGYAQMGVKVYAGDLIYDWMGGRPFHFCNVLTTEYDLCFDWYLLQDLSDEDMKAKLDEIASGRVMYTLCHHPDRGIYDEHWDLLNFQRENTPESEYRFANRYPDEVIDAFYRRMKRFLQLIQQDDRFEIVTYQDLADRYCSQEREITLEQIPVLKEQLEQHFFPVTLPDSYSLCDIFRACRALLLGESKHRCQESYGFLGEPFVMRKPTVFTREQMVASAATLRDHGFLPEFVYVDGNKVGPADWLRAALAILSGAESVRILPQQAQIDLWRIKGLRTLPRMLRSNLGGDKLEHLAERAYLQTWTIRFPKGTCRMMDE